MKLQNLLARSRPSTLPRPFIAQTVAPGFGGVRYNSITKEWKGASTEDHNTRRSQKGDTHDPASSAAAAGMKERKANEGIADETKSSGITQRGGVKHGRKAKQEHPAAPEPIIGMNDERAQKGH
ncbi:uncharacterized protein N7483_003342 [Penicillium malachiteum]|uniref:uncharacterized protein n=1 Tax=Penicillium malachiteum TaxID=1324776 RepID=UPI002547970E|nr:uncharacterized protein N7483_003342 [Penicillium malachiteum]KAJ5728834.1 hypothetical protein N7483_003342 [Penicillium malachiteum]